MVLVKIDIKNVALETHPDDKVIFRSPVVREATGGGLVSTADEVVSLVDGVGELELVPGPVIVTFQCRGMADTRPKRGTVPNSGPVTVADVIGQNFTFTPEVVGAAQAARNQAAQAAADAEAAEEAAGGHAEAAGNAANAASGHAQTATTKASEANASANTAGDHASAADTARQGAVTAQGLAETARDEAETKVQDALNAALPTKADKEHEHTTAQVTGLDAALEGKAPLTTLNTRVPENLSLRLDTTVGTRVFAGNTMIHGDTGRRRVPELSTSLDVSTSSLHGIYIRRVGDTVTLTASGVWIAGQWITEPLPLGFRTLSGEYIASRGVATVDGNVRTFGNSGTLLRLNFGGPFPLAGSAVTVNASWHTADPWPTSLPGLPA